MIFEAKELNKAYYDLMESIQGDKRFIVMHGGRNASKTHSANQGISKILWNDGGSNAIYFRNLNSIIKRKAYDPFVQILKDKNAFDDNGKDETKCIGTFYSNNQFIQYPKGNRLYFEGGDNYDKIKGIANVRYVIIDEADQFSMGTFLGINTSFRGIEGIKFILLFNPIDINHWLKKLFFDGTGTGRWGNYFIQKSTILHYTIEDNKFATQEDYDALDSLIDIDENRYNIERLGLWGKIKVDNPFFDNFNFNVNSRDNVPYFGDYPLIVSFDYGGSNYAILGQSFPEHFIDNDFVLREYFTNREQPAATVIREYKQENYNSSINFIVGDIVEEFGVDAEYLITGDSAGGVIKFMAILEAFYALGCYNVNFASRKKPSQEGSRTLQNWIFIKYGSNYLIDRRCLGLLGDMASVKVTMFGGIDDPDTIRNDIGHFSDATRYKDYNFEYKNYEAKTGEKLGYRIQRKIHQYTGD